MFFWRDNELPQSSKSLAIETPVWVQKTFGGSQILVGLSLFWLMILFHDPYMLVLGEKIRFCFVDMVQCASQSFLWKKHHPIELPRGAEIQGNLGGNCIWTPIWNGKKTPCLAFSFKGKPFPVTPKNISRRRPKTEDSINQLRWKFFIWDASWKPSLNPEKTGWLLFLLVAHWWV